MFLQELNEENQKATFYKLAFILSISEVDSDLDDIIISESKNDESYKKSRSVSDFESLYRTRFGGDRDGEKKLLETSDRFLSTTMDGTEIEMLSAYASELNFEMQDSWSSNYSFTKEILLEHRSNLGYVNNDRYHIFFAKQVSEALDKIKEDKDAKKKVMEKIIDIDLDISNINDNVTQSLLMSLDVFRRDVVSRVLEEAISDIGSLGLTIKQKKSMMFELAAIGFADGSLDGLEIPTLKTINSAMGLDDEFLEEAKEIIEQITEANREAFELINE